MTREVQREGAVVGEEIERAPAGFCVSSHERAIFTLIEKRARFLP